MIRVTSHDERSVDYGSAAGLFALVRVGTGLQPLMWALARGVGTCAVTFTGSRSCSARQTSDGGECRHGWSPPTQRPEPEADVHACMRWI